MSNDKPPHNPHWPFPYKKAPLNTGSQELSTMNSPPPDTDFAGPLDDLGYKRLNAENDNTRVTPIQVTEAFLRDLRSGKIRADRVLLIYAADDPVTANRVMSAYRAQLTRDQECVLLTCTMDALMRRWIR